MNCDMDAHSDPEEGEENARKGCNRAFRKTGRPESCFAQRFVSVRCDRCQKSVQTVHAVGHYTFCAACCTSCAEG